MKTDIELIEDNIAYKKIELNGLEICLMEKYSNLEDSQLFKKINEAGINHDRKSNIIRNAAMKTINTRYSKAYKEWQLINGNPMELYFFIINRKELGLDEN